MFKNLEKTENKEEDNKEKVYDPEEDLTVGNWKIVDLKEVELKENTNVEELKKIRVKSYRLADGQWKERGIGELQFLKNKLNGLNYVVQVQEQVFKVRMNFYLLGKGLCELKQLGQQERTWQFACMDCSDGNSVLTKFCVRFNKDEEWKDFKETFDKLYEENQKVDLNKLKEDEEPKKDDTEEPKKDDTEEPKKEETEEPKKEEVEEPKKEEVEEPKKE